MWRSARWRNRPSRSSSPTGSTSAPSSAGTSPAGCPRAGSARSDPLQDSLPPRIQKAEPEDDDEDGHLDDREPAEALEDDGPGEEKHCLHVEDHEQERVDVVADLGLGPSLPDGVDTALVGGQLLRELAAWSDDPGGEDGYGDEPRAGDCEGHDRAVRAKVGTHACEKFPKRDSTRGDFRPDNRGRLASVS